MVTKFQLIKHLSKSFRNDNTSTIEEPSQESSIISTKYTVAFYKKGPVLPSIFHFLFNQNWIKRISI